MSCRVIGRTLEHEILTELARRAVDRGCTELRGTYVRTAKNALVADLYPRLGFRPVDRPADDVQRQAKRSDDRTTWMLPIDEAPASPGFVTGPFDTIYPERTVRERTAVNVNDRLQDIFRTVMEDDGLVLTDDLTADDVPTWDSVAHVSLMFTIEAEFGLQFNDDQLTAFRNVGELRRFVEGRVAV